jgi:hypothetical protein
VYFRRPFARQPSGAGRKLSAFEQILRSFFELPLVHDQSRAAYLMKPTEFLNEVIEIAESFGATNLPSCLAISNCP